MLTRASVFETRLITLSYIYLGLITGEHPDPDRAARVINALLPGPQAARPDQADPQRAVDQVPYLPPAVVP